MASSRKTSSNTIDSGCLICVIDFMDDPRPRSPIRAPLSGMNVFAHCAAHVREYSNFHYVCYPCLNELRQSNHAARLFFEEEHSLGV